MESSFFSSFVITLREGVEGALAVSIILLYLKKTGREQLANAVWWGLLIAVIASIAGALLLDRLPVSGEIVEGVLMLLAAVFVGSMILWMWSSAKGLKKEIENKIEEIATGDSTAGTGAWFGLFFFTFLMIVREGIETVIFLSAVNLSTDALIGFLGALLGLALSVLFAVFFLRGAIRIDLGRFFKITGIVLMLFVVQLVMGAIHELGEGGALPVGPRTMAVLGPIVKNNALFLIGVLLIPSLMLVIPGRKSGAAEPSSQAERRLHLYQIRKQKLWRTGAALVSLFIVLFITYDFVYGQNRRLSPPVTVHAEEHVVRIPLSQISDGNLHRFLLQGTHVRFIALKEQGEEIAVAFDACDICGSQGYVQEGKALICLNCSADINTATMNQGGGCNPIPLAHSNEGEFLTVRVEDLKKQERIFGPGD